MTLLIFLVGIVPSQFAGIASAMKNANSESRLETLLRDWDKATQKVRSIHYLIVWTVEGRVLKDKYVRRVEGFVKRSELGRLDLKDEKGKPLQTFLLNKRILEMYNFERKDKLLWEMPVGFPEKFLDKGWWESLAAQNIQRARELFGFEFPAGKVREYFEVRLRKEDYWAYIQLIPKTKVVWDDTKEIVVVLDPRTHLVRQYRMVDVNGNRSIMDFQKVEINPITPITLDSISKDLPKTFTESNLQSLIGSNTQPEPADSKKH